MKAISSDVIIEGVRARKDGSLGLTLTTPELTTEEKAMVMDLQGVNCAMVVTPIDSADLATETHEVKSDLNQKPPSQRMRAVLYILWKQDNEGKDFPEFYEDRMEKLINKLKERIIE